MKLVLVFGIALILALTGCGNQNQPQNVKTECVDQGSKIDFLTFESNPKIEKQGLFGKCIAEATPVVFKGQLLLVSYQEGLIKVYDYLSKELIKTHYGAGMYGSAFVENDTLYYFSSYGNEIGVIKTEDLETWTEMESVLPIGPESIQMYNTSVTKSPNGFVMAYEVSEPDIDGFTWRVAVSSDLTHWTKVGERFDNKYSACPTVRYVDGYYYFIYLAYEQNVFISRVTRTQNFTQYENSNVVFLAPGMGEGRNTSDVDLIEFNGKVLINYIDGNQTGWGDQMIGEYEGTLKQMFSEMF